ncbi:hypothetical protein [Radiobacillus deserti]|uniref:Uncharacterized protein n=1 Tax=Radiobacillus deserti TaxID=2594883 RepID=A0A516KFQ8_9BACI|nr:hypothetical protein [Radiobacillus deserti]QDP40232.1 hypothetical protein FN924_08625 [Radiobacillus deserti]
MSGKGGPFIFYVLGIMGVYGFLFADKLAKFFTHRFGNLENMNILNFEYSKAKWQLLIKGCGLFLILLAAYQLE